MERRHLGPMLALAGAVAGCAAAPAPDAVARCPGAPDPGVVAALPAADTPPGDPDRGAVLFARECARCHSRTLAERGSRFFRDYPRLDCGDYLARAGRDYLLTAVAEGGTAVGRDEAMKPFRELLGDAGVADVVAHLLARPPGGR